jgi:hypothetical protein
LKGRDHFEDLGVHRRIILKVSLKDLEVVSWFILAEDRDQWRALVNTAMDFQVTEKVGNFLTN